LATKAWVVDNSLELRRNPMQIIDLIEGDEALLEFTYVTNPGAAWSMFSDYPQYLTLLAVFALVAMYWFRKQLELHLIPQQIMFGLICGGICGNLSDRLFREPAEVVDFIDTFIPLINYDYPIFNIADSGIFVGAISYVIWGAFESKREKEKETREEGGQSISR